MADSDGQKIWREDPDAALAEARRRIQQALEQGSDSLDFTDLTALQAVPEEIGQLTALTKLYFGFVRARTPANTIRFGNLSEITALSGLSDLTDLDLSGTGVADLSALSGLSKLKVLNLRATRVGDLSALSGLSELTKLYLSGTRVTDLSAMSSISHLTVLDLSNTAVSDLSNLSGLSHLTELYLNRTEVGDLSALSDLSLLEMLYLQDTEVSDLSPLLEMTCFAEERGAALSYANTPAADPARDRRLHLLSRLAPGDCAAQTVQYLKGTHPDFRAPPVGGGGGAVPLSQRLAQASPVGFDAPDGVLRVTNPGTPERPAPEELATRVQALRSHVDSLCQMAEGQQISPVIRAKLGEYRAGLALAEPTYILLDGPMAFLRGGAFDTYATEGLDAAFVSGWQFLATMHDDLRPLLLPPPETDDLPELTDDATPEALTELAEDAIEVAQQAQAEGIMDATVAAALDVTKDYSEAARTDTAHRTHWLRRGVIALGGMLAGLMGFAANGTRVLAWLETPQGQALWAKVKPLLDQLMSMFKA